ncbi:MAG: hypothetical protein AAFX78_01930 [Cyanobacteria bacterium J06638_20]
MAASKGITAEQVEKAILELTEASGGLPPTIREVSGHLGLQSTSAVQKQLGGLRKAQRVTWEPGKSRTLRVVGIQTMSGRCFFAGSKECPGCDYALMALLEAAERVAKTLQVAGYSLDALSLQDAVKAVRAKLFPEGVCEGEVSVTTTGSKADATGILRGDD